jgi:hypothetical protein
VTDLTIGGPDTPDDAEALPTTEGGLVAERERLSRTLRDTRLQLAMTQARLTALEQSSTMRFGKTLVNAAKRPWPRGAQLPRDLIKLWRERGGGRDGAELAAKLAAAQLADLAGAGERFLSALTVPGRADVPSLGLVVTGALTARGAVTLAPDAVVHPLLPHDADVLLEATGADLVIIEAAALLGGAPWAYAADPSGTDRGRRLARMIVMARSLGKPVVFLRNVPPHLRPSMEWIADSCDVVSDEGLGVQLARFNPIGASAGRSMDPVAPSTDAAESPSVRALLDAVSDLVEVAASRSWRGLPSFYQSRGLFVTADASVAREQEACGARVIALAGDAARLRASISEARSAGPLPPAEIRQTLRDLFVSHATAARLAALASAAGLPAGIVAGRSITVLASGGSAAELAASVQRQRLQPAEVVYATDDPSALAALTPLTDQGIPTRIVPEALHDHGQFGPHRGQNCPRSWELARFASSPWVAVWPEAAPGAAPGPAHLLDLAVARECSQADAVAFAETETETETATDYAYATALEEPALARRELLAPDAPPVSSWGTHGYRLFTIAEGKE